MGKVITITIRKGGSGKTTTAVNLASGLAVKGKKVLLVDLDSQANATSCLGVYTPDHTIADVLDETTPINKAIVKTHNLYLLPSNNDLAAIEQDLIKGSTDPSKNIFLLVKEMLEPVKANYDYIIVDTPPSNYTLTYNGIIASDGVIIPAQVQTLAINGIEQALETIGKSKSLNPTLEVLGILPTMVQANTNMSKALIKKIKTDYDNRLVDYAIPLGVEVHESQLIGEPLVTYNPNHKISHAYLGLTDYIINHYEKGGNNE